MNWDERYSIDDYLFGQKPAQALLRNEQYLVPGGETLLIADGEGRNSVYLAKNGFKITSSDSSIVAQQKAKALADSHNVKVHFKGNLTCKKLELLLAFSLPYPLGGGGLSGGMSVALSVLYW